MKNIDVLQKYGVTLRKLTHDKIELVRQWRVHPKISQYMEHQDEITPEQQEIWFRKIDTSGRDFYFIIEVDGNEIGLINVKDVDFEKKSGETGIFIWDDNCLNSDYGIRSTLCLHDFAFNVLGLETLHGHTLSSNRRANRLNKALGYVVLPNQDEEENKIVLLSKKDYFAKSAPIGQLLNKI